MTQQRVMAIRNKMLSLKIDALLISNYYNILYLSGFKTLVDNEREAWLLITKKGEYIFTDNRYASSAHNIRYISSEKRLTKHIQEIVDEEEIKTIGFEAEDLKFLEYEAFKKNIDSAELIPTEKLTMKLREVKEGYEISKIKNACRISDLCLEEIIKTVAIGKTEREIAFNIEFWLKKRGYDLAFYPIIAVDENSAIPHYDTRGGNNRKIRAGSIILIDFGAKHEDYLSDMTRMVFVGRPENQIAGSYEKLLQVQKKSISRINSESILKNVDLYCRKTLDEDGLPNFSHSTGHGVGLEIHEMPKVSPLTDDRKKEGQVITIEPGVYLPGKWGMRIEDTVLVGKLGAEVLTKSSKKLLII